MKRRFVYIISAIIATFVIFFVALRVSFPNKNNMNITLPEPMGDEVNEDQANFEIKITIDNIQEVVKSLQPSIGYSRTFSITSYWDDGSSVSTLSMSRRENQYKISETVNSGIKNTLITSDKIYIWYDELTDNIYSADINNFDYRKIDKMARLVSVDGLDVIDKSKILEAGYSSEYNTSCMYAVYSADNEGVYKNKVFISAASGLVHAAEVYENDKLIYKMETLSEDNTPPADEVFMPPTKG